MAYKGFKEIRLVGTQSVEDWYIANESIVDDDTLYTFTNEDGTEIIDEYIGSRFKVGVQEAPIDNKLYGRKNETWQEIDYVSIQNQDTSEVQKIRLYVVDGQIGYKIGGE